MAGKDEEKDPVEKSDQEKLKEFGDQIGVDFNKVMAGVAESVEKSITPKLIEAIAATLKDVEGRLGTTVNSMIASAVTENLPGIVGKVTTELEEKYKGYLQAGNSGGGIGGFMNRLTPEGAIQIINAFRQPTTDQAMVGQLGQILKWHNVLSKIEKGGAGGEDITKAIQDLATPVAIPETSKEQ